VSILGHLSTTTVITSFHITTTNPGQQSAYCINYQPLITWESDSVPSQLVEYFTMHQGYKPVIVIQAHKIMVIIEYSSLPRSITAMFCELRYVHLSVSVGYNRQVSLSTPEPLHLPTLAQSPWHLYQSPQQSNFSYLQQTGHQSYGQLLLYYFYTYTIMAS